ncbi:uncharacterized protein [Spinacia oleracea]|uniref:Uncharacterized protein n=1 Tax=Spinacia oleracea TaxID=3562 RepID=A0A9R0J8N2_SPIOL|nr:uncharacterized protein LOC110801034 [Spinacia oleracea]
MTEVVPITRIDRKSSIEFEPRTLNFRQIQSARDAALYVVRSRSIEEANQIFTEGMAPIESESPRSGNVSCTMVAGGSCLDDDENTYPTYSNQYFTLDTLRDVATAPF